MYVGVGASAPIAASQGTVGLHQNGGAAELVQAGQHRIAAAARARWQRFV